jgi:hypothetical protein
VGGSIYLNYKSLLGKVQIKRVEARAHLKLYLRRTEVVLYYISNLHLKVLIILVSTRLPLTIGVRYLRSAKSELLQSAFYKLDLTEAIRVEKFHRYQNLK